MSYRRFAKSFKRRFLVLIAVLACIVGIAAPAFAASRDDTIDNKLDGWDSARWQDNAGSTETRVTTYWCTREYRARIRKDRGFGVPDPVVGSEWIDCLSYDDAVRSDGATATGEYHYDIGGMDSTAACPELNGFCNFKTTAGTTVFW